MILEIILVLLAIPTGVLIAWLTRDELIALRRWFVIVMVCAVITVLLAFFLHYPALVQTGLVTGSIALISYYKSFDKRWTHRNTFK